MFWNLANKQGLEEFWKPMYSYKHIFSLGENTSHTVYTRIICCLMFKEEELSKELNYHNAALN